MEISSTYDRRLYYYGRVYVQELQDSVGSHGQPSKKLYNGSNWQKCWIELRGCFMMIWEQDDHKVSASNDTWENGVERAAEDEYIDLYPDPRSISGIKLLAKSVQFLDVSCALLGVLLPGETKYEVPPKYGCIFGMETQCGDHFFFSCPTSFSLKCWVSAIRLSQFELSRIGQRFSELVAFEAGKRYEKESTSRNDKQDKCKFLVRSPINNDWLPCVFTVIGSGQRNKVCTRMLSTFRLGKKRTKENNCEDGHVKIVFKLDKELSALHEIDVVEPHTGILLQTQAELPIKCLLSSGAILKAKTNTAHVFLFFRKGAKDVVDFSDIVHSEKKVKTQRNKGNKFNFTHSRDIQLSDAPHTLAVSAFTANQLLYAYKKIYERVCFKSYDVIEEYEECKSCLNRGGEPPISDASTDSSDFTPNNASSKSDVLYLSVSDVLRIPLHRLLSSNFDFPELRCLAEQRLDALRMGIMKLWQENNSMLEESYKLFEMEEIEARLEFNRVRDFVNPEIILSRDLVILSNRGEGSGLPIRLSTSHSILSDWDNKVDEREVKSASKVLRCIKSRSRALTATSFPQTCLSPVRSPSLEEVPLAAKISSATHHYAQHNYGGKSPPTAGARFTAGDNLYDVPQLGSSPYLKKALHRRPAYAPPLVRSRKSCIEKATPFRSSFRTASQPVFTSYTKQLPTPPISTIPLFATDSRSSRSRKHNTVVLPTLIKDGNNDWVCKFQSFNPQQMSDYKKMVYKSIKGIEDAIRGDEEGWRMREGWGDDLEEGDQREKVRKKTNQDTKKRSSERRGGRGDVKVHERSHKKAEERTTLGHVSKNRNARSTRVDSETMVGSYTHFNQRDDESDCKGRSDSDESSLKSDSDQTDQDSEGSKEIAENTEGSTEAKGSKGEEMGESTMGTPAKDEIEPGPKDSEDNSENNSDSSAESLGYDDKKEDSSSDQEEDEDESEEEESGDTENSASNSDEDDDNDNSSPTSETSGESYDYVYSNPSLSTSKATRAYPSRIPSRHDTRYLGFEQDSRNTFLNTQQNPRNPTLSKYTSLMHNFESDPLPRGSYHPGLSNLENEQAYYSQNSSGSSQVSYVYPPSSTHSSGYVQEQYVQNEITERADFNPLFNPGSLIYEAWSKKAVPKPQRAPGPFIQINPITDQKNFHYVNRKIRTELENSRKFRPSNYPFSPEPNSAPFPFEGMNLPHASIPPQSLRNPKATDRNNPHRRPEFPGSPLRANSDINIRSRFPSVNSNLSPTARYAGPCYNKNLQNSNQSSSYNCQKNYYEKGP